MALVERVRLSPRNDEYQEVCNLFEVKNCTKNIRLEIETIDKVFNDQLMQKFKENEEEYIREYGHVRTVKVFHGTQKANVSSILKTNLDVRRHGQHIGHRFGAGVSFSAYASYASHYCDKSLHDTMLLCYVLVSNIVEVPESRNRQTVLLEPPFLPNMFTKRYDTTAKNKHTMDVIVKFGSDTFYPAYVINFKRCSQSSPQSLSLSDEELVLLIRSMGFDSD